MLFNISDHLKSPFSFSVPGNPKIYSIKKSQKIMAVIAGILGIALAIIGAPIAFYVVSGFFKSRRIKETN